MANIALIGWPVAALILFLQLPLHRAMIWSVLLAYLFLPERVAFDFPGLPPLDKTSIPALALLVCVAAFADRRSAERQTGEIPASRTVIKTLIALLTACLLMSPVLTVLNNTNAVFTGERFLPGLQPWDVVNMVFANAILIVPFFLARRYLSAPESHRLLIQAVVLCGIGYSLLALIEVRLSPQLNMWVYGFYPHSFAQHIRGGGFRPMAFLDHGLSVGFFLFSAVVAAAVIYRASKAERTIRAERRPLFAGLWILFVLLISKNLGATMLVFLLAPIILFLDRKWQLRIAATAAIVSLAYPAVRQAGLVPTERITSIAATISEERAASFQFRLDNEDILLERALRKPIVGWGGWGRSRVYDEFGRDISTTDGLWVIVLGDSGWIGYIAFFGFLTFPVILLWRMSRDREIPWETIGLAMIMVGNLLYVIPNSTLSPIGWLMAGALAGYVQYVPAGTTASHPRQTSENEPRQRQRRYTRFGRNAERHPIPRRS